MLKSYRNVSLYKPLNSGMLIINWFQPKPHQFWKISHVTD